MKPTNHCFLKNIYRTCIIEFKDIFKIYFKISFYFAETSKVFFLHYSFHRTAGADTFFWWLRTFGFIIYNQTAVTLLLQRMFWQVKVGKATVLRELSCPNGAFKRTCQARSVLAGARRASWGLRLSNTFVCISYTDVYCRCNIIISWWTVMCSSASCGASWWREDTGHDLDVCSAALL